LTAQKPPLDAAARCGRFCLPAAYRQLLVGIGLAGLLGASACPPARGPNGAERPPLAEKWLERAKASYAAVDLEDAADALKNAIQAAPNDIEVRTWAGRVALARLDYPETLRLLQGIATTQASGLRGRAQWYAGEIDRAADELESMLQDPETHDGWAKAIATLARRGAGRKPFQQSGSLLAVSEMPRLPNGTSLLVPVEIDGEQALAMVATGTAEVTLDSASRKEPSWVSLRFAGKVEVKDVPAVVQDLSGISLLGVNLLRHLNVTFDYIGGQFIVRNFPPPIPPNATRIPIAYVKGGGMVMRSTLTSEKGAPVATLLLDSSLSLPLALDEGGWKKAGVDIAKLTPVPQDAKLKQGTISLLRLGTFDIPQVPAVFGTPISEVEKGVEVDLDGIIGSGLLAAFRVTLTDQGRAMWLEDVVAPQEQAEPPPAAPPASGPDAPPAPATTRAPNAPSAPPKSPPVKGRDKKAPSPPRAAE
jgi:hypothetical protein